MLSHVFLFAIAAVALLQILHIADYTLHISVLDVGQGDAIFIQTPEQKNILIDAGEGTLATDRLGEVMGFFDKTIDLFVLTHPHRDHLGGIFDVMQKYEIKQILLTGVFATDPLYQEFLEVVRTKNIPIILAQNDQDFRVGWDVYLDILFPFAGQSPFGQEVKNLNNSSIVLRLSDINGKPFAILAGDAEHEEELEILVAGAEVQASILKLGHHGSRTATSDEWLAAVNPETVVVSAGFENKFNHPHAETMEKVEGLEVRQTVEGNVLFNF